MKLNEPELKKAYEEYAQIKNERAVVATNNVLLEQYTDDGDYKLTVEALVRKNEIEDLKAYMEFLNQHFIDNAAISGTEPAEAYTFGQFLFGVLHEGIKSTLREWEKEKILCAKS
jgi:hypothetical protein